MVYFFHDLETPLYLLTIFAKNTKSNLSQAETNQLRELTRALVSAHKEGRHE